ncbi:MAG: hypothetical protein PHP83_03115 [Clostridia bacterium]|nr:hypothetical protein [Clostridia bacterium]
MGQLKITKKMLVVIIVASIVLLALFVGVVFQIIKIKKLQSIIDEQARHIEELEDQQVNTFKNCEFEERFNIVH